jgi:hypothetical protein
VRKFVLASLVIGTLAASAGVALSSPQFVATFQFAYSSTKPGSPSGLDGLGTWSDPGEPAGKPKEVTRIKVIGAPGLRLDTSALPICRASDSVVQRRALRACPASSKLGTVKGEAVISTGNPFNTVATLFNGRRKIIVVVMLGDRLLTNFSDDVGRRSVTVNLKILPGISLTRFEPHIPRHLRRLGKKRRAYVTTPPTCPASGVWITTAIFTYRDGSQQTLTAPTPCRQD